MLGLLYRRCGCGVLSHREFVGHSGTRLLRLGRRPRVAAGAWIASQRLRVLGPSDADNGQGAMPLLPRDSGPRPPLPGPSGPPCDSLDLPPMRLALAVRVCEVRERAAFQRNRILRSRAAVLLHRLRARTSSTEALVLELELLLPATLSMAFGMARRPGPSGVRTTPSLATESLVEPRETRDEPTSGYRRTRVVPHRTSRSNQRGRFEGELGFGGRMVDVAVQRPRGCEPGMGD